MMNTNYEATEAVPTVKEAALASNDIPSSHWLWPIGSDRPVEIKPDAPTVDFHFQAGPIHAAELDCQEQVTIRNGKGFLGMGVLTEDNGAALGRVRDLLCDFENEQVLALVLDSEPLFGPGHRSGFTTYVVPWCNVSSVNEEVIIAESASAKVKLSDDDELCIRTDEKGTGLFSVTQVLSLEGAYLGMLDDIEVNESTGKIVSYDIGREHYSHSPAGRKFAPIFPLSAAKNASTK